MATRAKWALWNGQVDKTLRSLEELYAAGPKSEREAASEVRRLRRCASDPLDYLRANQDSLPNYGERDREAGKPISTGWVESAVNEIIAKRMSQVANR